MALLPQSLDYTDKDFDALRTRIFLLIRSVFPEWTDDQVANFGNILVEGFCFVGDVLGFYQDNQAGESRISTAILRKNLIALSKLVTYTPKGTTAASVDETFTLAAPVQAGATFTIPAGDRVKTAEVTNPIFYQLLADLVFTAGQQTKSATVENSTAASNNFTSTGLANQNFLMTSRPYVDDSAVVVAGNGSYTQVDNFLDSGALDLHYTITVDQNDRATIRFGNGVNGAIPVGTIQASYKIGGGKAGRVEANKLTKLEKTSYSDSLGTVVRVSVSNTSASTGGDDRETNEQIRQNAPAQLRVLRRAVAREDYEIAAETVSGVARALMLTSNEFAAVQENEGSLYIVPVGGGVPSQAVLDEVIALFEADGAYPKPNTFRLTTFGAIYLVVNVSCTVFLKTGFSRATVRANIEQAIEDYFTIENADGTKNTRVGFGYYFQDENGNPSDLPWSDVFDAIRDTAGVRKVESGTNGLLLNNVRDDISLAVYEFPKLGTLDLIDGFDGTHF